MKIFIVIFFFVISLTAMDTGSGRESVAEMMERHRQAERTCCEKTSRGIFWGTLFALGTPVTMFLITQSVTSANLYDPMSVAFCFGAGFLSGYTGKSCTRAPSQADLEHMRHQNNSMSARERDAILHRNSDLISQARQSYLHREEMRR